MLTPLPYSLPDSRLLSEAKLPAAEIWKPDQVYVVLGRSNKPETSVHADRIATDDVILMKRPSGGEAVVLTPATLVVAFVDAVGHYHSPKMFFDKCNMLLIESFAQLGIGGLSQRGISDISHEGLKIVGSSMYKGSDRLFYHAVINVAELPGTIAWYLKHPRREPDYREGRRHETFVTSLRNMGYNDSIDQLQQTIREHFQSGFGGRMDS